MLQVITRDTKWRRSYCDNQQTPCHTYLFAFFVNFNPDSTKGHTHQHLQRDKTHQKLGFNPGQNPQGENLANLSLWERNFVHE